MLKQQMFRLVLLGCLVLAGIGGGWASHPVQAANTTWTASYFNNKNLSGTAVLTQQETAINYDWAGGTPTPLVNKDSFSVRWTRTLNVPTAGTYRFTATTDDGMRVWVDNAILIDSWYDSQVHSLSADVYLPAGDHQLKVEYYEAGGQAVAKVNWIATANPNPAPIVNWKGEYYNNMTLTGTPALTRDDTTVDFDWGVGSPDSSKVTSDGFSARWTRSLTLTEGKYRFYVTADDGVRLWVNGRMLVDQWHDAGLTTYSAEIDLPGGGVPVQLDYFENVGGAVAKLSWIKLSDGAKWRGEYFNNTTLTGAPILTRDDALVNFNWGVGSPAATVNADNFSARWTRSLNLTAGTYRFTATSDDGVRIYVNGQLVVNGWSDHQPQTFTGDITVAGGSVPVIVEYYDRTGGAQVAMTWSVINNTPAPTPNPNPAPNPSPTTGTGTVVSPLLNVRTGPGIQNSILHTLTKGNTVTLTGYRSADANWVQINWNNSTAWVSGKSYYLQTSVPVTNLAVWSGSPSTPTTPTTGNGKATISGVYYLNMRQGPGVGNAVIKAMPAGTVVTLLGRNVNSSWLKVQLTDGTIGWMSAAYLSTTTPLSSLSVTN